MTDNQLTQVLDGDQEREADPQARFAIVAAEPQMLALLRNLVDGQTPVEVSLEWWRERGSDPSILHAQGHHDHGTGGKSNGSGRHGALVNGFARRLEVQLPRGRTLYLQSESVDWIEAANQYVRLHLGSQRYLLRDSLTRLAERLDPRQFLRIHRSSIVNLDRVSELQVEAPNLLWTVLHDGTRLRVSQAHREALRQALACA